jgi:sulfur carrier protein ThiS adenylyltransferase
MRITLNGKEIETNCCTVADLCLYLGRPRDIVIINGYQTTENHQLAEADVISVIEKGVMPAEAELESMMVARHTPQVHARVKAGRVAVAGLGGLGSNIAVMLARTGIGNLLLVDFDVVEPSNLNRQNYYISDLGLPKTVALEQQIKKINPFIKVESRTVRVEEKNVSELFAGYEVVCEAFDDPKAKAMLVNTLLEQLPGVKIVAASGMAGYTSSNQIKTARKMQNLYICGDFENGAKVGNGLMAPRVQVCAGHQANMVLRLLLGLEEV